MRRQCPITSMTSSKKYDPKYDLKNGNAPIHNG